MHKILKWIAANTHFETQNITKKHNSGELQLVSANTHFKTEQKHTDNPKNEKKEAEEGQSQLRKSKL